MLRELSIKSFAIIDDLTICFDDGLTILSGETGAGKSIIINAVNLLLGSRASAKLIRDGCDAAELAARFDLPPQSSVATRLAESGYPAEDGLMVRRIIVKNNRHRIYINDRMATMQMLSSLAADLASISGQHAHQGLLREESHLAVLDRFGGLEPQVRQMRERYAQMLPLSTELDTLYAKKANREKEVDLLRFQAEEIAAADIQSDEDAALERERLRLKNAEFLHRTIAESIDALYGADGSVLELLGEVRKAIEKAASLDDQLVKGVDALADHQYGLEDVTESLRLYLNGMDTSAERIESVEQRLDLINRLKRKYGGSLASLFAAEDDIKAELDAIDHLDEIIEQSEAQLAEHSHRASDLARHLSAERQRIAKDFSYAVENELAELMMADTQFSVHFFHQSGDASAESWLCVDGKRLSPTGIDQAAFMIAPNLGESAKPLASIASGGELSRVVLALKAILADTDAVETVIFDEVDAGIGGAVADVVGRKLERLSRNHQLICITHLPQIARFGSYHYAIEKQVKDGRTTTTIRPMGREERVNEIARMLGGETISPTALEHARALLA